MFDGELSGYTTQSRGITTHMDTLSSLLSSRVKSEVFRLLFGPDAHELHVRDIARRAHLNDATVRQELRRLREMGLVSLRRNGNRAYYRAETSHPLYPDIRNIVLKTAGLVDVLREALEPSTVKVAFVFGSIASGNEKATSDVDLMVIGSTSLRQLSSDLSGVDLRIGREINPHVFSPHEFAERRRKREHFVTSVLNSPKLFIIGNDHDLATVG